MFPAPLALTVFSNLAVPNLLSPPPPGAGHGPGARFACRVCLALGLAAPLVASGGLLAAPRAWAALYTPDTTVIDLGAWGGRGVCGSHGRLRGAPPSTVIPTQLRSFLVLTPVMRVCCGCPGARCSHTLI